MKRYWIYVCYGADGCTVIGTDEGLSPIRVAHKILQLLKEKEKDSWEELRINEWTPQTKLDYE